MKNILLQVNSSIIRLIFLLIVLTVGLSVFSGCASVRKITRDVTGPGRDLKKKVAITVFANRARTAPDEIRENFHRQLTAKLTRACSDTLLVTPEEKTFPDYLKNLPRLPRRLASRPNCRWC